jgi:arylsulfatase A-like enzyme
MIQSIIRIKILLIAVSMLATLGCQQKETLPPPNILWLVSEDNGPFLGCYGDTFATTPHLDKLATEGFLYTHAYANAPVCAPARNTILTGVYANSNGNQHMRSTYQASEVIRFYPEFFQEKGYYCTNNAKTDYNTSTAYPTDFWDECNNKAHYNNRAEGQPFFAVFNTGITHESSIHKSIPTDQLRHDPQTVPIPPYHPHTDDMKHDWAQYYDKMEDMDQWVGQKLKELDEAGLAENTIVFYFSDHGGVLGRSKRFVYESGTHVPFIVRIPKQYKHLFPAKKPGDKVDRLISFVDLASTLLSLIDVPVPDYLQGHAFLGNQKTPDPDYAYMFRGRMDERYDMCRAVRDKKYRYIRNYMPYRIYGQKLEYLWRAPSMRSWEEAYQKGECDPVQSIFWNTKPVEELYDTENDPWEVNNLADDPAYKEVLERMRDVNNRWMLDIQDCGLVPEAEMTRLAGSVPFYDYVRSADFSLEEILEAANKSGSATIQDVQQLIEYTRHENSVVRYWGATGLLNLGQNAVKATGALTDLLADESANVRNLAAEVLLVLGEKEKAIHTLAEVIRNGDEFASTHAMNVVECQNIFHKQLVEAIVDRMKKYEKPNRKKYDQRLASTLLEKWQVDPADYGLQFDW